MTGLQRIAAERKRQQEEEGWSKKHDRSHSHGELAMAASVYAAPDFARLYVGGDTRIPRGWPLNWEFKPTDRIRELEKAGALIAAELDRLEDMRIQEDR
jgi:hypothetical protein